MESLAQIFDAAHFAAQRHAHQRRKGATAEPYINHLLEVAQLVSSTLTEPDPNLVIAALLHDTVEDVNVTPEEITHLYGADVAALVAEVTDDKSLPKTERKRLQVENASHKTPRAQVIKLADKISNLRAILQSPPEDWSTQRKQEYFEWAKRVVDNLPNANPELLAEFNRLYARISELK